MALFAFGWLVLFGAQLNVPSQLPIRLARWRPRRYAPPESLTPGPGLVHAQRLVLADRRADPVAMQIELDALAGTMPERFTALLRSHIRHHRGEYAGARAEAAAQLDAVGTEDLVTRHSFCLYTGLALLADQPVDPDAVARPATCARRSGTRCNATARRSSWRCSRCMTGTPSWPGNSPSRRSAGRRTGTTPARPN